MKLLRAVSVFLSLKSLSYFVSFFGFEGALGLSSPLAAATCMKKRSANAPLKADLANEKFILVTYKD